MYPSLAVERKKEAADFHCHHSYTQGDVLLSVDPGLGWNKSVDGGQGKSYYVSQAGWMILSGVKTLENLR